MRVPEDLLGSLVDNRYRLDKVLGEGGFGAVYVATRDNGTQVALKVLADDALERVGGDDRFRREAELARRLDHPNVVKVLDEGIDAQGTRFIAFELLKGRSLADEVGRWGALQPRRAIHVAMGILDALEAAHAIGIIHRDLKPANVILLDGSDRLKVLDFGIAKSINKNTIAGLTQAGQVLGTPAYMAVEQLTGDPVTPATDLFALGVVLVEMILGKPPYPAGSTAMDIVRSRLTGVTLELPADLLDNPLGKVALRATEPHPQARYQSAAEMRSALQNVLSSPHLHNTAQSAFDGPMGTSAATAAGHPHLPQASAPPVAQAGFTAVGQPPPAVAQAGFTAVGQPPPVGAMTPPPMASYGHVHDARVPSRGGSGAGAIVVVAALVGVVLVGGLGATLWWSQRGDASQSSDDDDDETDETDDEDEDRKRRKKRKKKDRAPKPPRQREAAVPPNPIPPPPVLPPPPTTFATRVVPCRGAALQNQATLRGHVSAIGWRVTGQLQYCAGSMINFRCTGGGGRGVTAEQSGTKGSAAVVRFGSAAAAKTHADGQRGKSASEPVTWGVGSIAVLYIQMPDAEADKLMARICK